MSCKLDGGPKKSLGTCSLRHGLCARTLGCGDGCIAGVEEMFDYCMCSVILSIMMSLSTSYIFIETMFAYK